MVGEVHVGGASYVAVGVQVAVAYGEPYALLGPYRPSGYAGMLPFWLAQLPHHREVVPARGDFD